MAARKHRKRPIARTEETPAQELAPRPSGWLPALIVVAGLVVYVNSFSGTYVLDDVSHIWQNEKIQSLEPITKFLLHDRRPLVSLSLAVNFALGKYETGGYHLFNVAVHLAAALTLFGVVRRTLAGERFGPRHAASAQWLALAVALIWVIHPLQTQSVTYLIQRAEAMMGLFYLMTLYCVIRGAGARFAGLWYVGAVAACAAGMGSKAVMVTAPLMVLSYDRVFLSSSFRQALRCRWALYAGLVCTWYILIAIGVAPGVLRSDVVQGATVGFAYKGVTPLEYLLTQPGVILYYVRLSLWPSPLCLDYCWPTAGGAAEIVPPLVIVALWLAGVGWALLRRSWLGFVGLWFFLILAPTSSFIPIRDAAFEHRMYLPLASIIVLVVVLWHRTLCGWLRAFPPPSPIRMCVMGAVLVAVCVPLGCATILRNPVYASRIAMYRDVISSRPDNARAYNNLGTELRTTGQLAEAMEAYQTALKRDPEFASAHHNTAAVLEQLGQKERALEHFRRALDIEPERAWRHYNLGNSLAKLKRLDDAKEAYNAAIELEPRNFEAHLKLASIFMLGGSPEQAIAEYRLAIEADPGKVRGHYHLGLTLREQRRLDEAAEAFRDALQVAPQRTDIRSDLGATLVEAGLFDEGIAQYRRVVELDHDHVPARYNLGLALQQQGRLTEAAQEYREALRLRPDYADAHCNLGIVLGKLGRREQAMASLRQALTHDPGHVPARYNLGILLYKRNELAGAVEQFEAILYDHPEHKPAAQALTAARRRLEADQDK